MDLKEKQLLLADLCARLPYGVKVFYKYKTWDSEKFATSIRLADGKIALSRKFEKEGDWFPIEEAGEILIKPYLRPMSSMTEGERQEYNKFNDFGSANLRRYEYKDFILYIPSFERVDWLNSHHFDYRGLIEKNLALESPDGIYNN